MGAFVVPLPTSLEMRALKILFFLRLTFLFNNVYKSHCIHVSDQIIKYNESKVIVCKIDASPPATIKWYIQNTQIFEGDDFNISPDGSTLKILKMSPKNVGAYTCVAFNKYEKDSFGFNVKISGLGKYFEHFFINGNIYVDNKYAS